MQSLVSVASTLTHLKGLEKSLKKRLQIGDYELAMRNKFLAHPRETRRLAQNTVCKTVRHLKDLFAVHARRSMDAGEPGVGVGLVNVFEGVGFGGVVGIGVGAGVQA